MGEFKGGEDAQKENIEAFNNIESYTIENVKNNYLELGRFKLNLYNLEDQLRAYNSKCLENYN